MTDWAAKVLEGVPRHYDANCDRVIMEADALAAIEAEGRRIRDANAKLAEGDGLVERATAALEGVTDGPWWTEPEGTVRNDSDGNPRWDLPRIVRYNETGNTVCKAHLIGGPDPDAALFNARFIAFTRQWVPEAAAHIAALTERNGWLAKVAHTATERGMKAEAERDALRAKVARLEGALGGVSASLHQLARDRDLSEAELDFMRGIDAALTDGAADQREGGRDG